MMNKDSMKYNSIIKTTDEQGKVHSFKLVEIVEVDKKEYGLFEYLENKPRNKYAKTKKEDDELIIMRITQKSGEHYFEVIEDDDEFNKVMDYIEKHEDELEFE